MLERISVQEEFTAIYSGWTSQSGTAGVSPFYSANMMGVEDEGKTLPFPILTFLLSLEWKRCKDLILDAKDKHVTFYGEKKSSRKKPELHQVYKLGVNPSCHSREKKKRGTV